MRSDLQNALQTLLGTQVHRSRDKVRIDIKSQLVLSFFKLLELGSDWLAFERFADATYTPPLAPDAKREIFALYQMCANESPEFQLQRKRRNRKPRPRSRQAIRD